MRRGGQDEGADAGVIRNGGRNTAVDGQKNGKWQKQRRDAEVRTRCVGGCSVGYPPGSRWASWRCLPWPSTGCAGWVPTWRAPPSDRGWAARTAPLSLTAARQWPCAGSAQPPRASTRTRHTEPSIRPGGRLHLRRQTRSPPVDKQESRVKTNATLDEGLTFGSTVQMPRQIDHFWKRRSNIYKATSQSKQ